MDRIITVAIFGLFLIGPAIAGTPREFVFTDKSPEQKVAIDWDDQTRIAVSPPCRPGDKKSCEALKRLKKSSMKAIESERKSSTANPGALICLKIGGKVVIGRDAEMNQNAFCRFSDESLIDCGTLIWFGRNK